MDFTPIINSVPPEVWFALLGGLVSVVTQFAKKWLDLQSPKVVLALTSTLSLLVTVLPSLLASVSHNPAVLGRHAVLVIGAATLIYRYVIQPADSFLLNYKQFKATQATVEATSVPVATNVVVAPAEAPVAPQTVTSNEFIG